MSASPIAGQALPSYSNSTGIFSWLTLTGWLVFGVYSLSIIGLTHDVGILFGGEMKNYEEGDGLEAEEDFSKNVGAAPIPRQLGLLGLFGITLYCLATSPQGVRVQSKSIAIFSILLLGWATLSVIWSTDRGETLRELFRIFVYVVASFALAKRFPSHDVCIMIILGFILSMMFATGVEIATGNFKPWMSEHRLQGTLHSNDLGRQALVVVIGAYAFSLFEKPRWFWWTIILIAFGTLLLTKSRTSFFSLFVGVLSVHLIRVQGAKLFVYLTGFLVFVSLAGLVWELGGTRLQSTVAGGMSLGRSEKATSLTGRLPLWREALKQAKNVRMTGAGYGAFWTVQRTKDMGEELLWFPRHAHSMYVEMIVNLGYVGLSLFVLLGLATLQKTVSLARMRYGTEYIVFASLIIAQFVYGISEAAPSLPRDQGLFNLAILFSMMLSHPSDEYQHALREQID